MGLDCRRLVIISLLGILLTPLTAAAQLQTTSGWRNISPPARVSASDVVLDPADANTYYVLSEGRVVKTTDGGKSWLLLPVGPSSQLLIAPSDPSRLYSLGGDYVNRSADGGVTWTRIAVTTGSGYEPHHSLLLDPEDRDVLYAAASGLSVSVSRDSGETWRGLPGASSAWRLAWDANAPRSLYGLGGSGVWRSTAGEPAMVVRPDVWGELLAVSPTSSTVYVAGRSPYADRAISNLLVVGAEQGSEWTAAFTDGNIRSIVFQTAGGETTVFLSTPAGLYRTNDSPVVSATSFERIFPQYPDGVAYAVVRGANHDALLATAECEPARPFACPGVLISRDRGETWTELSLPRAITPIIDFAVVAPARAQTLYAAVGLPNDASSSLFHSSVDGGRTWKALAAFPVGGAATVDATDPATVYVLTRSMVPFRGPRAVLMRSRSAGESWSALMLPADCESLQTLVGAHPTAGGVVFATCNEWVHRSLDWGATWIPLVNLPELFGMPPINPGLPIAFGGPYVDPARPARVFLTASYRTALFLPAVHLVARSMDGGGTFALLDAHNAPPNAAGIRFDPFGPRIMTAAQQDFTTFQLYESVDDGVTWTNHSLGAVLDVQADAAGMHYASTSGGILRREPGGTSWMPTGLAGEPLPFPGRAGAPVRAMAYAGLWPGFRPRDSPPFTLDFAGLWALESRVTLAVSGSGRVTGQDNELSCGAGGLVCSGGYAPGSVLVLTPRPEAGWVFAAWEGYCTSDTLVLSQDRSCVAVFTRAPTAATLMVSRVAATTATVAAAITPGGFLTTAHFEYGPTTAYGRVTTEVSAGSGAATTVVVPELAGLTCSTTYHYRVVATNANGVFPGRDQVFRTAECPGVQNLLLQHQESGCLVSWHMNGVSLLGQDFLVPACVSDPQWQVAGGADFDGDGHEDLLFRHVATGRILVWLMNGIVIKEQRFLSPSSVSDPDWRIAAVGDFDGDGQPDLVIQNIADGRMLAWLLNGTVLKAQVFLNPSVVADPSWRIVGSGDIDLDGKPDLFFQNIANGLMVQWLMDGVSLRRQDFVNPAQVDPAWLVSAIVDMNGDTTPDMILQHRDDGRMVAWPLMGPNLIGQLLLNPFQVSDPRWRIVGPK